MPVGGTLQDLTSCAAGTRGTPAARGEDQLDDLWLQAASRIHPRRRIPRQRYCERDRDGGRKESARLTPDAECNHVPAEDGSPRSIGGREDSSGQHELVLTLVEDHRHEASAIRTWCGAHRRA